MNLIGFFCNLLKSIGKLCRSRAGKCSIGCLCCVLLLPACATSTASSSKSRLLPTLQRVKHAAVRAVQEKDTWIPSVGAALIAASGTDQSISDWASTQNPVFGSVDAAKRGSDITRDSSKVILYSTLLLNNDSQASSRTMGDRLYEFGVEQSALSIAGNSTVALKGVVGRERPNGSSNRSFPSSHSTDAFSHTTLAKENLKHLSVSSRAHNVIDTGLTGLAMATAWGRVEGKMHYPTDVLVGAALANFTTHFFHNLWLSDKSRSRIIVSPNPSKGGGAVGVEIPF